MKTEVWRQVLIPVQSHFDYANPFLDVCISAEFVAPSGRKIKREAFWDGGKEYKFSFAPTEEGLWSYCITAPQETGLNGMSGTVEAVPYEGKLPIFKHGFLKAETGSHYLMHDDGTPFFWLGDTHWDFAARERWDESNHPMMDSMFRGMADRRADQGYNVYQTNLRSEPDETGVSKYWMSGKDEDVPNISFYQNELDRRMYYLADLGFVNALGLAWFEAVGTEGENLGHVKNLARYIVARYGALPVVWTLCGEVAGYAPGPQREKYLRFWREVALYMESLDGYGSLQTAHAWSELPYAAYYEGEEWFDFSLNQAGHGNLPINFKNYREWFAEHPNKPFVEGEAMYEYCSTLEDIGPRCCTDDLVRRTAYTAIQCGCCGYTYGAQGIWDSVWDKNDVRPWAPVFNRYGVTWQKAIDGPGGAQMGIMKRFYEKQEFYKLLPDLDPTRDAGFGSKNQPLVLASADRARFVIYFSNSPMGTCRLSNMQSTPYRAKWFNPRNGEYSECWEVHSQDGLWESPYPPDFQDWLLVVERV